MFLRRNSMSENLFLALRKMLVERSFTHFIEVKVISLIDMVKPLILGIKAWLRVF